MNEDEDLQRLARAITEQAQAEIQNHTEVYAEEVDLAAQIAEDLMLQAEAQPEQSSEFLTDSTRAVPPPTPLTLEEAQASIEALLFISDKPLSRERLRELLGPELDSEFFSNAITQVRERYESALHGIELVEIAGGYQLRTKPDRAPLARKLVKVQTQRLSSGSMETLAIIAYQQPVMKEEIDKIRGVDSSYFVRGLMDRKLIKISGRSELPGRPMLYSTTTEFLEVFGLKELSSLPSLRELEDMIPQSQSGSADGDDPKTRELRRLVGEMKSDRSSALHYNPKEDEIILGEIRERVSQIPTSTPYLDELKAREALALQMAQQPPAQAPTIEPVSAE